MDDLADILEQVTRKRGASKPYVVERPFFSRQNRVYLIGNGEERCVLKVFTAGESAGECRMLRTLQARAIPVPRLRAEGDNWLLMSYLEGTLLADLLTSSYVHNWTAALAALLATVHRQTADEEGCVLHLDDQNPRNYLLANDGFYLLDVGNMVRETAAAGFGRLLANLLLFGDVLSEDKRWLCRTLLAQYEEISGRPLARAAVRQALLAEVGRICRRRGGRLEDLAPALTAWPL